MKAIIILIVLINTVMAVDFVIPEINRKFDLVDAANAAVVLSAATNTVDINNLEAVIGSESTDGIVSERMVRYTFDVEADATGLGAYDVGVDLPSKAIITDSFVYVKTQFVDAGAGTVAIHCEDANNVFSATDITGSAAGAIIEGSAKYSAKVDAISAACNVTVTLGTAAASTGALNGWIKYVVHD